MRSFHRAGLVTDPLLIVHSRTNHFEWYPPDTPQIRVRPPYHGPEIDDWVRRIDLALFVETPFDWSLADRVRAAGKPTVLMPMHEWFPRSPAHKFDLMACPSLLDLEYFAVEGLANDVGEVYTGRPEYCTKAAFLPVPIDDEVAGLWEPRTRARRWLHSCGNVGYRFHKGTDLVLAAAPLVKNPDWRLTVRAQDPHALGQAMARARWAGDPRVKITTADVPRDRLYADHDVLLAPERFNGLSLPLQEARAAGLLVCTTDRFPANAWLPRRIGAWPLTVRDVLIRPAGTERTAISENWLPFDECVIDPAEIAARIDDLHDADIRSYSDGGRAWAEEQMSWRVLRPVWERALGGLLT